MILLSEGLKLSRSLEKKLTLLFRSKANLMPTLPRQVPNLSIRMQDGGAPGDFARFAHRHLIIGDKRMRQNCSMQRSYLNVMIDRLSNNLSAFNTCTFSVSIWKKGWYQVPTSGSSLSFSKGSHQR